MHVYLKVFNFHLAINRKHKCLGFSFNLNATSMMGLMAMLARLPSSESHRSSPGSQRFTCRPIGNYNDSEKLPPPHKKKLDTADFSWLGHLTFYWNFQNSTPHAISISISILPSSPQQLRHFPLYPNSKSPDTSASPY